MKNLLLLASLLCPVQEDGQSMMVSDVIEWMAKESKRRFVFDEGVTASFGSRRVSVSTELLDKTKAYELGLTLLRTVGLAAFPLEESVGGGVRIIPASQARAEQLKVYASLEALPRADEICILSIPVDHAGVRNIHAALINVMQPQGVLMVESSGMLIITDYASNLRKAGALVRLMDVTRGASVYTLTVAILQGETAKEASVPEAFRGLDLKAVTDRNSFVLREQAGVRVDFSGEQGRINSSLRLEGRPPMSVSVAGQKIRAGGITLERLTVNTEADEKTSIKLLETRLELKDGAWAVAGTIPGGKEGTVLVVLVRATPVK